MMYYTINPEEVFMCKRLYYLLAALYLLFYTIVFAQWQGQVADSLNLNWIVYSITAVDENVVWAVVDTNYRSGPVNFSPKFLRTTNGGTTWKSDTIAGVINTFIMDITALDSNTAWVTTNSMGGTEGPNATYKTTNGGKSWTRQIDEWPGSYIYFFDNQNGMQWGSGNLITQNGGETWQYVNAPDWFYTDFYSANNAYAHVGDTIWVGAFQGRVCRSINRGQSWTLTQTSLNTLIYSLAFQDANNGMAISSSNSTLNQIARTTDGGLTWTTLTSVLQTPKAANIAYVPGTNCIYVITSYLSSGPGSAYTPNGGITWEGIDEGYYNGVSFVANGIGWAGGITTSTNRNVYLYKWTGGPLGINEGITNQIPKKFELSQNYPNPFNPATKISYSLAKSGLVRLKIYNILGQEIQTLVNQFQRAGEYQITFDAKHLATGIYFYKLQVGSDYVQTKKMILMR
jgi:photosystem II stability/assembly factor-like uncharacterized protein